jgi:hypothetical protein
MLVILLSMDRMAGGYDKAAKTKNNMELKSFLSIYGSSLNANKTAAL